MLPVKPHDEEEHRQAVTKVVKALVKQMHSSIEIIACPILREVDGLAMSSRNALLNAEERKIAGLIPAMMQKANEVLQNEGVELAKLFIKKETNLHSLMKLDYYEICDAKTLNILSVIEPGRKSISLIALYVGKIRLIDNLLIN